MNICFIGLGSIGTRHLRNLSALLTNQSVKYRMDAFRSGNRELPMETLSLLNKQYFDINALPDDYDIIFICSPTSCHYADINRLACHTKHMFIEKPVFDVIYDLNKLNLRNDGTYYVACPLRYNAVLQYIKDIVDKEDIYAVRAICSTYLPDWRPNVDYRTVYSAHKDMGGGVSIDLIHEWDYLCWMFGMPQKVNYVYGKHSNLEIDSDDIALYTGEYSDKLISLHLDYFGRFERREIEVYTNNDTIVGDIRNGQVRFLKDGKTIELIENRDTCQIRELKHFLDIVNGKIENDSSIEHAQNVLAIAKGEWKV